MKNKILLPILLLAAMTVTGCGKQPVQSSEQPGPASSDVQPTTSEEQPPVSSEDPVSSSEAPSSSEDPVTYGVAINNKAQLTGEWYKGTTRDLDVTLTPAANALQEIAKGNLVITSSDPTIVAVTGLGLNALAKGQATITVKYHNATDTVAVDILSNSAKDKYGVAHDGTEDDPFTNEDALAVAKSEKYEKEVYYVRGIVDRFYYAPGTNASNGTAFYLKAATTGGEQFEIFKCFKADGSQLSDDDIWVNGEATVYGAFTKYNSQYETSSATFVSCTGEKPQPRQTLEKSFAETLAAGQALADGDTTWDYYKFIGFVTAKDGNNFWLTGTKGEALVSGKSDETHGNRDIYTNAIELYGAGKVAELAAKLLEGAEVEVTMLVKNYHGTVENGKDLVDADVVVKNQGTQWAVPEPAVATKTLAEFIALENSKAKAYNVTATVKSWKDASSEKDKYGNMVLTDGTNDLVIYGASATATALAWDNSSAYAFTNPKDFLTNEVTAALAIGDEVTMKLIRADYNGAIQGSGIITNVVPAGTPQPSVVSLAKYTFTTQTANNTRSIDAAGAKAIFTKASGSDLLDDVTSVTNVYEGGNGGSGDTAFTIFNIMKIGKSKSAGEIKFSLKQEVSKIVLVGGAWTATASVTVNGTTVEKAFSENIVNKAGITDGKLNNPGTLAFTFAASKDITIAVSNSNSNANFGVVLESMEFFGEAAVTPTPAEVVLPIIAKGNQDTKVEGAGAWIYIDTTGLSLTAEMANAMAAAAQIQLTVAMSDETPDGVKDAAQHYVTGADAAVVVVADQVRFDDFGTNTVRLYVGMDKGLDNSWKMKHSFEISIPLDATTVFVGSVEFIGGALTKINGEAYVAPVVIEQPVGTFFASPELTAGGQISIMVILGAANAIDLRVNGVAVSDAAIASFDSATGEMIVSTNAYGRIKVTYNPETGLLEGLSLLDATAMLKYDGYVNLYGNEKLKYWNCDGSTEELQAQFVRRYGSPWNNDTGNADRVVKDETNFKFGSGAKVRAWGDGRIALAVKDFDAAFNGRNLSFWVYNPGSADISLQAFGYKATGYNTYFQIFDGKKALAGQWTYISVGFTAADMYAFQIVVPNGTSTQLTFDDICLF